MDARKPRERLLGPALRTQPDRRLVALAKDGGEAAQEEIVRRYRAALVRYAASIVGADAAEDVVQEALAKGLAALGRADEELRLRPWLYAIVRNTALNHRRDAGPATEQLDENYDGVEQPPQALERREWLRSLIGGLRRLPDQQREALVKRELEGCSHEEIGAALGVSSGAARQLIFRARESLRVGFGSLLPMPLLRRLAESGGDGAVGAAAGAGGGALAAKTALAVFAAGAAVTAGVAIDHDGRGRSAAAPDALVRPAVMPPGGSGAGGRPEPVGADPGSGRREAAVDDHSGRGDGQSGRGPGERHAVERDDGPRPSESAGPGSDGVSGEDFDGGRRGSHSGRGGSGRPDRDDGSGPSGSDRDGSASGHGGSDGDTDGSGSGPRGDHDTSSTSDGGTSDGSTSDGGTSDGGTSNGGTSDGSGSSGGGSDRSGASGGGSDDVVAAIPSPAPAPAPSSSGPDSSSPSPAPVESGSSGSGSSDGGEGAAEIPRDLSGGTVSQGSDDPD